MDTNGRIALKQFNLAYDLLGEVSEDDFDDRTRMMQAAQLIREARMALGMALARLPGGVLESLEPDD